MRLSIPILGAGFGLALLLGCAGLSAQQEPDKVQLNTTGEAARTDTVDAVAAAALAADLAEYGRQHGSALALVDAAHILVQAGVYEVDREAVDETEGAAAEGDPDKEAAALDPAELLEEARRLARGNPALQELIDNVAQLAAAPTRGRIPGPGYSTDIVGARGTDSYVIRFRGGEPARIAVRGDGDTDLDCYVYDENGNLIDSDTRYTDRCSLSWRPRWTGPFRLRIRNLGPVWNAYAVVTN